MKPGATPPSGGSSRHQPVLAPVVGCGGRSRLHVSRVGSIRSQMRTFIQPQKKQTEEKIEVRVDANIAGLLKEYAEFLESPPGYVVTEILRKAFRKDKAFAHWKQGRE